jgi:hypothetical protein
MNFEQINEEIEHLKFSLGQAHLQICPYEITQIKANYVYQKYGFKSWVTSESLEMLDYYQTQKNKFAKMYNYIFNPITQKEKETNLQKRFIIFKKAGNATINKMKKIWIEHNNQKQVDIIHAIYLCELKLGGVVDE